VSTASFLIALIAIIVVAKAFGEIAERLGQPAVLGELIGGAVVGVSGLGLVNPHDPTIHLLAQLGVIFLLFLIGLETDLKRLMSVGGSATAVAIVGVVLPLGAGYAVGALLGFGTIVSIFLGASLTATSVGITARVLSDLGHLRDAESQVILGAAVVDDIIGLVLLTIVGTLAEGERLSVFSIGRTVIVAFGFVVLAIVIGSWLAPWLIKVLERLRIARGLLFASIVAAFGLAYVAERVGSAMIIGSFAAGIVLARTGLGKRIEHEVHDVAQFFVPIFFVSVGAALDFRSMNARVLMIGGALTLVGILGKVAAGFVAWNRGLRRLIIGVGMIPRGEVGLIFAQIGLSSRLLDAGLYNAVALMVMLTTFIAPMLLRRMLVPGAADEFHGTADYLMDAPLDDERRGVVTSPDGEHPDMPDRRRFQSDSPSE
jgi:Kef-type K+ transport system membrane component KefB